MMPQLLPEIELLEGSRGNARAYADLDANRASQCQFELEQAAEQQRGLYPSDRHRNSES